MAVLKVSIYQWQHFHWSTYLPNQAKNIENHQHLLTQFFSECEHILTLPDGSGFGNKKGGEVHVTLKEGEPYQSWKVGPAATKGTDGNLSLIHI